MSASFGILRVAPFAGFVQRFDDLIGSATTMSLYFIHSRRWRENHDAAIKAFVARAGTTLEVFLPDLENHELMYSLGKHFEDGPLIPALVGDAYRYFARLARDFRKPAHVWLFGRYPTYSFYKFDDGAVIAMRSEEHTSELQSRLHLVCRLLLEKKKPEPMLQATLFVKVVLALLSDRPAAQYLDAQRVAHLDRMRGVTAMRKAGPLSRSLLADYG